MVNLIKTFLALLSFITHPFHLFIMESKCLFCEPCRGAVLEFLVKHGAFNFGVDPRSSPLFNSPASSILGIGGSRSSSCSLIEYSDAEQEERAKKWNESLRLQSPDVMALLLRGPFEPITPVTVGNEEQTSPAGVQNQVKDVVAANETESKENCKAGVTSSASSSSGLEYFTASETNDHALSPTSKQSSPDMFAELPSGSVSPLKMQKLEVASEIDSEELPLEEEDGQMLELEEMLRKEIDGGK